MAKKEKLDYAALVRELRGQGPERLYLLWGEEDYLREQFLAELTRLTVEPEAAEFNHRRLDGPEIDMQKLAEAVNAMPFLSAHTLVEVRGFDINRCRESAVEALQGIVSDIPETCTLVFVLDTGYEPDGRLAAVKLLKKNGRSVEFTAQEQNQLLRWIVRRCEAGGKKIGRAEAEHLIFCGGTLMNRLIPEIDKLTAYAKGESITRADIDAAVDRLPEAEVFNMTDCLSRGDFDGAAAIMGELLQMREHPIMLLAMVGQQMRRLYAARLAIDQGLGKPYVAEVCDIKFDFIVNKLLTGARGFTLPQLARAVELCAEYDYRMKSSSEDDKALLCDLLLRLALGETDG